MRTLRRILEQPLAIREMARLRGYRSALFVPLMRDGKAIGTIGVTRARRGCLPIIMSSCFETFADQAVIAIANARLFNEHNSGWEFRICERQTVTADMLKSHQRDPRRTSQPVLDTLSRRCATAARGLSTAVFRLLMVTCLIWSRSRCLSEAADEVLQGRSFR